MKYFGIGVVMVGVLLLAGNAFDFYFHSILETYKWIGWIPIGLGVLLMIGSEKGVGG